MIGSTFSRQLQIVRFHVVFRTLLVNFMSAINFDNSLANKAA